MKYTQFFPVITDNSTFAELSNGALADNGLLILNYALATNVVLGATINVSQDVSSRGFVDVFYRVSGDAKIFRLFPKAGVETVLLFMEEGSTSVRLRNRTDTIIAATLFKGVGLLFPQIS